MTEKDYEAVKAMSHGLLLGCALPVIAYNIMIRKYRNLAVYSLLIGAEAYFIWEHVSEMRRIGCDETR
jgi:hypothetical protein